MFMVNPYDRCISNSTIKVKSCAIAWYVDDNNVSHINEELNTDLIETMAEYFISLELIREKKHKLLVMEIYLLADRKLSLFINDYIKELIALLGEEIRATVSFPSKKGFQNIDESSTRL